MKKSIFLAVAACGAMLLSANTMNAQEAVVVEEDVTVAELTPCKEYYDLSKGVWFLQVGAGMNAPMFEKSLPNGEPKTHITAAYNLGFGKWMTPYLGWRVNFLGGALHYDSGVYSKSKYVSADFDIMWDMFNSIGGVNTKRVFSIVPFVGLGGTFGWDYTQSEIMDNDGAAKINNWTLPVSAGLQFRFRLCNALISSWKVALKCTVTTSTSYPGVLPLMLT